MILFVAHDPVDPLDDDEEEKEGTDLDEALLDGLDDEETIDDALLEEELDPLLKESAFSELDVEEGVNALEEDLPKPIDDDEEEDVDDYDSFDDEDEM